MSNEATVQGALYITDNANLVWKSPEVTFRGDITGKVGPAPGAVTIATSGTDIDLSQFTQPAYGWVKNLDTVNYFDIGIWDPETLLFYPLTEVQAGEFYPFRLSRNLKGEWGTGGAGTSGPNTNRLRALAHGGPCVGVFCIFEN